jgi:hypothetical protein
MEINRRLTSFNRRLIFAGRSFNQAVSPAGLKRSLFQNERVSKKKFSLYALTTAEIFTLCAAVFHFMRNFIFRIVDFIKRRFSLYGQSHKMRVTVAA